MPNRMMPRRKSLFTENFRPGARISGNGSRLPASAPSTIATRTGETGALDRFSARPMAPADQMLTAARPDVSAMPGMRRGSSLTLTPSRFFSIHDMGDAISRLESYNCRLHGSRAPGRRGSP